MKCEQCDWKKVNEHSVRHWSPKGTQSYIAGKDVLYQCKVCGRLQKIYLGN